MKITELYEKNDEILIDSFFLLDDCYNRRIRVGFSTNTITYEKERGPTLEKKNDYVESSSMRSLHGDMLPVLDRGVRVGNAL